MKTVLIILVFVSEVNVIAALSQVICIGSQLRATEKRLKQAEQYRKSLLMSADSDGSPCQQIPDTQISRRV